MKKSEATGVFKHTNDEIIEYIRQWYDNYCFAKASADDDRMFNSDMIQSSDANKSKNKRLAVASHSMCSMRMEAGKAGRNIIKR